MMRLTLTILFLMLLLIPAYGQVSNLDIRKPVIGIDVEENSATNIDVSKIPNFTNLYKKAFQEEGFKGVKSIPIDKRIKIRLQEPIIIDRASIGDYFKAEIIDDIYLTNQPKQLLCLRGSWIRGVITFVKKPTFLSKTGKIVVLLDQITSPAGSVIPVSATLDIQRGIFDQNGDYIPAYSSKDYAGQGIVTAQTTAVNLDDIDENLIGKLMKGTLDTVFVDDNNYNFFVGQQLQIVLKGSLNIAVN